MIGSFGPVIQLVNFEKIIGSFGIGKFCSSAWSLKFKPIPINFDGADTHAPILRFESNSGSLDASIFFIFSNVSKFKVSGFRSFITDDKSLYLFLLSINAGFSDPVSPILNNFILLSFQSHMGIFYI